MYSFFQHPNSVCMSYIKHAQFSGYLGSVFLSNSMKAFTHALFPNIFISSTSDFAQELPRILENAGCKKNSTYNK